MNLRDRLAARLAGRVVLLGIGNRLRGDDAAGCLAAEKVQERIGVHVIDAEEVPESFLGRIVAARPNVVVLLDAVDLGAAAGSVALVEREDITAHAPTTHRVPLPLLMEFLERGTGADVFLLAVQPSHSTFGLPASAEVMAGAELVADTLNQVLAARSCDGNVDEIEVKEPLAC